MSDSISKSWFLTLGNPEEHGYTGTPEEICYKMRDEWIGNSATRVGAWAYCVSATGFKHVHMVLEDAKAMRFSYIKNNYYKGANIQETKGNRKQAEDYIQKRGVFAEKGETVEFIVRHGEIQGRQGRRTLDDIYKRLESGETPQDILAESPSIYMHYDVIKKMYFDIRSANTPIIRPMKVIWHTGKSGSGKSYERVKLASLIGEDNIYYVTAFNSGSFDNYNGQKVLWIEDYRGEYKLQEFLRLLDVYKAEIPARFTNVKALWEEVHITSVLTPQQCYPKACQDDYDRIEQLLRRITSIQYHFKDKYNMYYQLGFPPNTLLNDMLIKVDNFLAFANEFVPIDTLCADTAENIAPCDGLPVGAVAGAEGEEHETK